MARHHSARVGDELNVGPQRPPHDAANYVNEIRVIMRSVLFGALGFLFAGSAFADNIAPCESNEKCVCNVQGGWTILHDNAAKATLSLNYHDPGLFTSLLHDAPLVATHIKEGSNSGTMSEGRINGRHVVFIINWSNQHKGRYEGRVGLDGRITGTNFDTTVNPAPTQRWHTQETFPCYGYK